MVIYSWNINGYKTCDHYGGLSKIIQEQPDFICLQEVKIADPSYLNNLFTMSYEHYYNFSVEKGHNGVYIYSKHRALNCCKSIGTSRYDKEGRFICLEFEGFYLINVYMPHGGRDKKNLEYKLEAYWNLMEYLKTLNGKQVIIVGDFNIAYSELDVERYKYNQNNIMFTRLERELMDQLYQLGYIDAYRQKEPMTRKYTWWPYAFSARERNVGWRIDYCLVTPKAMECVKDVEILEKVLGSDHCPIRVVMEL